ncbi:hypothetical protein JCM30471_16270 [Desulfuromonas carbonis]|uniref:hypothetical protein n=1 Tax=Desulfuromonas sp. DDH964 TaxID=1823759 RepID=UPI00078B6B0D|nr:hypothetical protein [Desulfuromonas sp. DDH964]AMV73224.1 hypothetical protein DBW_2915 [Desulfuromonas sp. DDH964]
MKKFCVQLTGHNYLLPYDGEPRKMGFRATRIVRANSPEEAGVLALRSLVRDPRLVNDLLNGRQDPSTLAIDSIQRLGLFKGWSTAGKGLDFFFEDLPGDTSSREETS